MDTVQNSPISSDVKSDNSYLCPRSHLAIEIAASGAISTELAEPSDEGIGSMSGEEKWCSGGILAIPEDVQQIFSQIDQANC